MNLEFSRKILENTLITNFIKIRPVGVELFHAGRQADRGTDRHDEANSHFSLFWKSIWKGIRH